MLVLSSSSYAKGSWVSTLFSYCLSTLVSLIKFPVAECEVWEAEEEGREILNHTLDDLKGQEALEGNTSVTEPAHKCDHGHHQHAHLIRLFRILSTIQYLPIIKYLYMPSKAMSH